MNKRVITSNLINEFKEFLYDDEKSKNTIEKYLRDIRAFATFVEGREITKVLMLEYKASIEKVYALTSTNSMIAALNAFCRYMEWFDCCIKQFKVQKKTYCSENDELSREEYMALVKTAEKKKNKRLSLVIQTICGTGIRVSELQYITVEAVRKGEAFVSCKGKSRKVFLVSKLCKKLLQYAKTQNIKMGEIFITKNKKSMNRGNIWREMKSLCKEAGVAKEKVYPHNLRHLFARTFYKVEKDIAKLADILGHTNINTTRIYIISTGAEHRQKLENMRLII